VPPGIADAVVPNPVFNLMPAATVDEGNNWINISWGPLSMLNPVTSNGTTNVVLGNYALLAGSVDIDSIVCNTGSSPTTGCTESINASGVTTIIAPQTDFFGNTRPDTGNGNHIDIGAVEFQGGTGVSPPMLTSIAPSSGRRASTVNVTLTGTNLTGTTAITVSGTGITVSNLTVVSATAVTATFTISLTAALSTRTVSVTTPGGTSNTVNFAVVPPTLTAISPTSGARGATVPVSLTGTGLTGATAVNVSGGVTVSGLTVVDDTHVTANFTIARGAGLGARTVAVVTPGGTTNTVTFTVTGATVTISAPSPSLVTGTTTSHFGTVSVSNASAATGPLTLTAAPAVVKTVGPAATSFSITGGTCVSGFVINPGGSCTIQVTYNPSGTTAISTAHISLANTGAATGPLNGPNFNAN